MKKLILILMLVLQLNIFAVPDREKQINHVYNDRCYIGKNLNDCEVIHGYRSTLLHEYTRIVQKRFDGKLKDVEVKHIEVRFWRLGMVYSFRDDSLWRKESLEEYNKRHKRRHWKAKE